MNNYPEQIEAAACAVATAQHECSTVRSDLALREALIAREVLSELTPDGRQRYTNDTARAAEIEIRRATNEICVSLRITLQDKVREQAQLAARLEALRVAFRLDLVARQESVFASQP